MKHLFILAICFLTGLAIYAQEPVPAAKGITYGATITPDSAISVNDISSKLENNAYTGKVQGKVVEVCQEKGCWMKVEKADGEKMMVKFKDYAYFMPKNIVGQEVVLDGEAKIKETSVKQLKHYAKDAGKSDEEIAKIKEPKKELIFVAKGVVVL
ncbi:DUF4920 domain-containing protein [Pollutibacter soli]|uniref:DUF4920 domain-containing protein n=1 Tax=Pollutibacter soli TaxID=3034157 RepID=UPI00301407D7